MNRIFVEAIGVSMPGLAGWPATAAILRGEQPWLATVQPPHQPQLLPPNERRRATAAVRLAFQVAEEALAASELPADMLAGVFASSDADTDVIHRICSALVTEHRAVSPTDFHNSVHNAAPGYWSIAAKSFAPSVSLSAWDAVFAAGLLEATGLIAVEGLSTLLVTYDTTPPEPLLTARGLPTASSVALILTGVATRRSLASLDIEATDDDETRLADEALEELRMTGTASRALTVLDALARREPARVVLAGTGRQRWAVSITPC